MRDRGKFPASDAGALGITEIVVVNKEQVQPVRRDNFIQFIFRLAGESPVQHFSRNHGMCGVIRLMASPGHGGSGSFSENFPPSSRHITGSRAGVDPNGMLMSPPLTVFRYLLQMVIR